MAHASRHFASFCLISICAAILAGCGGDSGSSSAPTAPSTTTAANAVLSCGTIRYRGETQTVGCSVPGQTLQPSAVALFFPGRTDCVVVSCSSGCATAIRVGASTGSSCQ